MVKATTPKINHINGNKGPFCFEKEGGLREHKLLPMESAIKIFGHTHPGSDNNGSHKKKTMVTVIKHHLQEK